MSFDISDQLPTFKLISSVIEKKKKKKEVITWHLNQAFSVLQPHSVSLVDSFTWQMSSCTLCGASGCTAAERHLRCEFVIWTRGLEFSSWSSHEPSQMTRAGVVLTLGLNDTVTFEDPLQSSHTTPLCNHAHVCVCVSVLTITWPLSQSLWVAFRC